MVGWSVGGHPGGRGVVRIRPRPWPNAPPQSRSDPETKQKEELVHFKVQQKGIGEMKHVFFYVYLSDEIFSKLNLLQEEGLDRLLVPEIWHGERYAPRARP